MSTVQQILAERQQTHGDYIQTSRTIQQFKTVAHNSQGWGALTAAQKEAIEMTLHKLGRILCGNPDHPDHWQDIAGYATCALNTFPNQSNQE